MKLRKNWENLMDFANKMFDVGYSLSMSNVRRWVIFVNDNQIYNKLSEYKDEIRGNSSLYSDKTDLDVLYEILQDFVKWYAIEINEFECWLNKKKYNLLNEDCFE